MYNNAQAKNNYLIKQRREDYERTLEISKQNRELEEKAKEDKSAFDWNYDISHSTVILRLQAN